MGGTVAWFRRHSRTLAHGSAAPWRDLVQAGVCGVLRLRLCASREAGHEVGYLRVFELLGSRERMPRFELEGVGDDGADKLSPGSSYFPAAVEHLVGGLPVLGEGCCDLLEDGQLW